MLRPVVMAAAMLGGLLAGPAQAAPVNAAAPIALFDVELLDGTDLRNTTGLQILSGLMSSRGAGDFTAIPGGTQVAVNSALYLYTALGGLGETAFSFSIGDYGVFTETAAPLILAQGVSATSTSIEAYLLGIFAPSGPLGAFTPGPASFDVSFTRSASTGTRADVASTSGSGTLASPPSPVSVPEPASWALLGMGPALLTLLRLRRWAGRAKGRPARRRGYFSTNAFSIT